MGYNIFWRLSIMRYKTAENFLSSVESRNPNEKEFHQAVREVVETLWPFLEKNPQGPNIKEIR